MTTASSSTGLPLRKLRWPALPAVDLLEECHWLVNIDARKNANPGARHKLELPSEINNHELLNLNKQKSPYRQLLRRPKPPAPSLGSPAQRAAKSILKLKERLEGAKWPENIHNSQEHAAILVALAPQQQPVSRSKDRSSPKSIGSSLPTTSLGTVRVRTPSPNKDKTPLRSPRRKKKKKKRPPTREERELSEKQERLVSWLKANPDTASGSVVNDTGQRYRGGAAPTEMTRPYSLEVESRIESAMQCRGPLESGVRLWDDPVRSMLAAEMTSESVFGGAVPTRALAFHSRERAPPSCLLQSQTASRLRQVGEEDQPLALIKAATAKDHDERILDEEDLDVVEAAAPEPQLSVHAQNVFGLAHRQFADGAVVDALATLEAGIRQSLSTSQAHLDAVSDSHGEGFNYSVLAHESATRLQLYYRARHRQRVTRLVLLQRQWRWWHARRRALKSLQFANKHALVIQRCYRPWHTHVTQLRSAVRIQRCFRVFGSQKFLIRFRQVCRLLLARQARRRQVKTRMRMIGKMILLFRKRRRRIALIQGLWRRRCAQAQRATLLASVTALELGRHAREDAFVAEKLDQARQRFREFLGNTRRGRKLVHWQAEKPWLRFRRLRHNTKHWDELLLPQKTEIVALILPNSNFQGLHERALCQMLIGKDKQLPALPKVLKVSVDELAFLAFLETPLTVLDAPESVGCYACCPWWSVCRERMESTRAKLSRRAAIVWWTIATYPKEYCAARIWPIRKVRRELAQHQLENDFARVFGSFLRVWFRRIDSKTNTPAYACEWCSEAFSTSSEFYAHGKCASARAQAEAEWTALKSDLQFARRQKWRCLKRRHDNSDQTDNYAFDLEAASVRRLRRSHSLRKALGPLVAALETCTASGRSNAVIPLELATFVLQYLDDSSHPLVQTAEHRLVRWSTLIGTMEVENSRQTPESSGRESRWIRKDDLRSRLIIGSKWRGVSSRWRRTLGRHSVKYRPLPGENEIVTKFKAPRDAFDRVASKWEELQLWLRRMVPGRQRRSKTAQQPPISPAAAGTRVLPVTT